MVEFNPDRSPKPPMQPQVVDLKARLSLSTIGTNPSNKARNGSSMKPPAYESAAAPEGNGGSTDVNGNRQGCSCCPYGYHLDLDFVAFAEDVASGRDTMNRRKTPDHRYGTEIRKSQLNGNGVQNGSNGTRKFLNDVVNDLNELSKTYDETLSSLQQPLQLNTDDGSSMPSRYASSNHNGYRPTSPVHYRKHAPNRSSRLDDFQRAQRAYDNGNARNAPYGNEDSFNVNRVSDRNNAYSPFDPYATLSPRLDAHEYSKTPLTVCANQEVSEIFSEKPRTLPPMRRSFVTSAPTSPNPGKPYYTALGQSLANIRNRAPLSPILHEPCSGQSVPAFRTTPATLRQGTPRRTDPLAVFFSDTLTPSTITSNNNNNNNNNAYYTNSRPPMPRRHFEQRRSRILSPEPEHVRSPSTLRSTNLQNRTYYTNVRSPDRASATDYSRTVPYRTRASRASTTIYDNLPSSRNSAAPERSAEPASSTLDWRGPSSPLLHSTPKQAAAAHSRASFASPLDAAVERLYSHAASAAGLRLPKSPPAAESPRVPPPPRSLFSFDETTRDARHEKQPLATGGLLERHSTHTQTPARRDNDPPPPARPVRTHHSQTDLTLVLEQFTQTARRLVRERGDQTDKPENSLTPRTNTVDKASSPIHFQLPEASTDTEGLEKKRKWNEGLSVEFQYCIGHESEHQLMELEKRLKDAKTFADVSTSAQPDYKEAATHHAPPVTQASTQAEDVVQLRPDQAIAIDIRSQPAQLSTAHTQTEFHAAPEDEQHLRKREVECGSQPTQENGVIHDERAVSQGAPSKEPTAVKVRTEPENAEHVHLERVAPELAVDAAPAELLLYRTRTMTEDEWDFVQLEQQIVHDVLSRSQQSALSDPLAAPAEVLQVHRVLDQDLGSSDASSIEGELIVVERTTVQLVEDGLERKRRSPQEIQELEEAEMLANLDRLACFEPDRFSIDTDVQTVIRVEGASARGRGAVVNENGDHVEPGRQLDPDRTDAIRKLLTEQPARAAFQRETKNNRSYRVDKSKADDLDYITEKHTQPEKKPAALPSTPSADPERPLKEMVVLKKAAYAEPVCARIPRPKLTRFAAEAAAETADEAAEAADKLTPLRSELQYFDEWRSAGRLRRLRQLYAEPDAAGAQAAPPPPPIDAPDYDSDDEAAPFDPNDPLSTSSNSSLTSDENEEVEGEAGDAAPFRPAPALLDALHALAPRDRPAHAADWAHRYVQHEWLRLSTKKHASPLVLKAFLAEVEQVSPQLLDTVINMQDQNGNTALHYAVSHENYGVVSALLDGKSCRVDDTNKAGYSPVMLAALCDIKDETEAAIVQRLFERGNVNAKAVYHGQTALMLAVSHGRIETTNLLLDCGADVNLQDIDGSTALMCAAEHGHKELVKILLKRPGIDASLTDCDKQSALSIAMENQHRDIGVLIYAHLNYGRTEASQDGQHGA